MVCTAVEIVTFFAVVKETEAVVLLHITAIPGVNNDYQVFVMPGHPS